MKLKHIYIYILLFIGLANKAQINLVPNYSFEDTIGDCQIQMAIVNLGSKTKNWYTCFAGSSVDYYNTCVNSIAYPTMCSVPYSCRTYQIPHSGQAFIGLWIYEVISNPDSASIYSEDVAVKLNTSLKAGVCYYAEFYANLGNTSNIAINQLGMLLSNSVYTTTMGSFTNTIQPQVQWDTTQYFTDTLNWVKISAKFIAQGGEQYLTIGNFKDGIHLKKKSFMSNFITGGCTDVNTKRTYFLIDDVSLYELPTPQLQNAYIICPNSDSLVIGDTARVQTHYQWYVNGVPIDTTSYIKIKPPASASSATYTYVLHTTNCSTSTQTVVVTYSNNCEPIVIVEPTIPNVFTPNGDNINDVWEFSLGKGNTLNVLNIFNRWGLLIKNAELKTNTYILWDGRTTSGEACSDGVYFYTLQYTDANGDVHKKNGYISLLR
jgi:gliding motility-associated-like protein